LRSRTTASARAYCPRILKVELVGGIADAGADFVALLDDIMRNASPLMARTMTSRFYAESPCSRFVPGIAV
jgi:hypothetical protein